MTALTAACLINNYNYGRFVTEAVRSAVAQSRPFDEIIVVDDGSTDDSVERLTALAGEYPIRVLTKSNEGQLSAFNRGTAVNQSDVVMFLDADDLYDPRYLEQAMQVFESHRQCDFLFTALRQFDDPPPEISSNQVQDWGCSVALALFCRTWIGAPTSCLALRRELLEQILPIPYLEDWRTRADDCLIYGASLLGGHKYSLDLPLIRYRCHGANAFARRARQPVDVYHRRLALNRLFELMLHRGGWQRETLGELAHREFQTIDKPTFRQWKQHLKVPHLARVRWSRRFAAWASMTGYYLFGLQK